MIWPFTSIGLMTVPTSSTTAVADHFGRAGVRIDLDLADMRAVREVAARRLVGRGLVEAGLHALRQLVELERRLRHLVDAEAAVGAGDGEAAVLELHVGLGGLQHMGGELLALGDDLFARP